MDLIEALGPVVKCVSAHAFPELSNGILFVAEGQELTLSATDLELSRVARITLPEPVETPISLVLDGSLMLKFSGAAPGEEIRVEVAEGAVVLRAGRSRLTLKALSGELYPTIPIAEGEVLKDEAGDPLSAATLAKLIERVAHAASTDLSRPNLASVALQATGLTTTDGHRLARAPAGLGPMDDALIPVSALKVISRALGEQGAEVRLSPSKISIVAPGSTTIARLTDARYPDWGRVIPKEPPVAQLFFSAPEVLSALKRLRLVSGEVIISGAEGEQTITLSASGEGEGEELIEVNGSPLASDLKIKISIPFLSQALAIPDHWQVKAHYFGSDRPLLLLGDALYSLIMPMVLDK